MNILSHLVSELPPRHGKGPEVLTVLNLGTILLLRSRISWGWIQGGDLPRVLWEIAGVGWRNEPSSSKLCPVSCLLHYQPSPVHRGLLIKTDFSAVFICPSLGFYVALLRKGTCEIL